MEYLYVVLGLLVLYLFMNKCGCRRVEGLSPAQARNMTQDQCSAALPQYIKELYDSVELTCRGGYGDGDGNECFLYGQAFGKAVEEDANWWYECGADLRRRRGEPGQ